MSIFDGKLPSDPQFLAQTYAAALRDNFNILSPSLKSMQPADVLRLQTLSDKVDAAEKAGYPSLAQLFSIEIALLDYTPDDYILENFWSVEDRFDRVVSPATLAAYTTNAPPKGSDAWTNADKVRWRTKVLLGAIHSNYLINLEREKIVQGFKIVMIKLLIACVGVLAALGFAYCGHLFKGDCIAFFFGMTCLIAAGMCGAVLSISRRMQNAVSDDALSNDGLFALFGLGLGWAGIGLSIVMGGAFAIVIYIIVQAGALAAGPPTTPTAATGAASASTSDSGDAASDAASASAGDAGSATAPARQHTGHSNQLAPSTTPPAPQKPNSAKGSSATDAAATNGGGGIGLLAHLLLPEITTDAPHMDQMDKKHPVTEGEAAEDQASSASDSNGQAGATEDAPSLSLYGALHLKALTDFFKMLLLAFLAGFAEQFVPDILDRLTKTKS